MWLGQSAIPPVAEFARVSSHMLEIAASRLASLDGAISGSRLAEEFARLEEEQPALADWIGQGLTRPLDDAARGLGITLGLTIWIAFELQAAERLRKVTEDDCESAEQLLATDEDLRKNDPKVLLESDDIIAVRQPEIALFLRARFDETVEAFAEEIDVDDVDAVYRMLLVEILVLSYAVRPPPDQGVAEMLS